MKLTANQRLDAWPSDCLINYLGEMTDEQKTKFRRDTMVMHRHLGHHCVENLKQYLGNQDFTWQGSDARMWVWERGNWRVFASNGPGVAFEFRAHISIPEALAAWEDFLQQIKLPIVSDAELEAMFK